MPRRSWCYAETCKWHFRCFLPLSSCRELRWLRAKLAFSYTDNPCGWLRWICLQTLFRRWRCKGSINLLRRRSHIMFLRFLASEGNWEGYFSRCIYHFFLWIQLVVSPKAATDSCLASSGRRHLQRSYLQSFRSLWEPYWFPILQCWPWLPWQRYESCSPTVNLILKRWLASSTNLCNALGLELLCCWPT